MRILSPPGELTYLLNKLSVMDDSSLDYLLAEGLEYFKGRLSFQA